MSRRPKILGGERRRDLAVLVALSFGQAGAMVATAFATRDVFVVLRGGGEAMPIGALISIAAGGLTLFACRALEGRVGERAGQSYAAEIRRALFLHVSQMPLSAVARRRSGALALRYVGDLAAFKGWIARGLSRLISALITIPSALVVLYLLEPLLLVAAIGPLCAVMAGILVMSAPLGHAHSDLRSRRARLAAAMAERLPQGIQLRRSGRLRTELRALKGWSGEVAKAGVRRESLAAAVRALPDAGAGLAGALCLGACVHLGLGIPEAVAALTALTLVAWPLRQLADVADRRRGFLVASAKLDRLLDAPRMPALGRPGGRPNAPAIRVDAAEMPGGTRLDFVLEQGGCRRLAGPQGSGKSALLLTLAGFDAPIPARRIQVFGRAPGALAPGEVLYLGRPAPGLAGSLRREATLGIGRRPDDAEIQGALEAAALGAAVARIGGLAGKVAEGRRNLTASEQAGLLLARGLLARPKLALVDADEIGLGRKELGRLLDHLTSLGAAVLIVTSDAEAALRLGPAILLERGLAPALKAECDL
ncbi:ATP-binding cassette, subfamily B [Rhodovulum sp. ES.010]|uniref:ABC transporter transmembrane domain-containing protein n=1 Tax=Rhodovulum sp. ES.010 TaxID=1882821 RepID=UPI00092C17E0|nr:ABC transporter transmembrane domain-containing protein [Rhodovulum sp. ES.010]SIO54613.1 ATP-binding cassette, subfamily B [Rhodovulum sp. ES.010]